MYFTRYCSSTLSPHLPHQRLPFPSRHIQVMTSPQICVVISNNRWSRGCNTSKAICYNFLLPVTCPFVYFVLPPGGIRGFLKVLECDPQSGEMQHDLMPHDFRGVESWNQSFGSLNKGSTRHLWWLLWVSSISECHLMVSKWNHSYQLLWSTLLLTSEILHCELSPLNIIPLVNLSIHICSCKWCRGCNRSEEVMSTETDTMRQFTKLMADPIAFSSSFFA